MFLIFSCSKVIESRQISKKKYYDNQIFNNMKYQQMQQMNKSLSSHGILQHDKKKEPINQKMNNMEERILCRDRHYDDCQKQEDALRAKYKEDKEYPKQMTQLKTQTEEYEKYTSLNQKILQSSISAKKLNIQFVHENRKKNTRQTKNIFLNQSYTFLNDLTEEDKFKQIEQKAKLLKEKQKKQRCFLKQLITKNMSNRQSQLNRSQSSIFASNNNHKEIISGKGYNLQRKHHKHQRMQSLVEGEREISSKEKEWSFMIEDQQQYSFESPQLESIFEDNTKKQSLNLKQYSYTKANDSSCLPATTSTVQNNSKTLQLQKQHHFQVKILKQQKEQLKKENIQLKQQKQEYLLIILKFNEEKKDMLNQLKDSKKEKEYLKAQSLRIQQILKKINLEKIQAEQKVMQERIETYSKFNIQLNDRLTKLQLRYNFLKQDFTEKVLQLNQATKLTSELKAQYNCQLFQLKQQLSCYKKKNIKLQALIRKESNKCLDPTNSSLNHKITMLQQQILTKNQDKININHSINQKTQFSKYLQMINLKNSNSSISKLTTATNQEYCRQKNRGNNMLVNLSKNK